MRSEGKYHSKTIHGGQRDAARELNSILASLDNHTYIKPSRLTVKDLTEQWMHTWENKVEKKTWERYCDQCRNHIIPHLGQLRLHELRAHVIQEFLDDLCPVAKGKKKLAPRTVNHIRTRLIQILDWAVRLDFIYKNPARCTSKARVPREEMQILTESELRVLFAACTGTSGEIPILIAAFTGMRQGEVLGLTWDRVDLDRREVLVTRSLERTHEGFRLKETKTEGSMRTTKFGDTLLQALRKHKTAQDAKRADYGAIYNDYGLVCCRDNGDYVYGTNLCKGFQSILKDSGIKKVRFQDLRHTHASHLIRAGMNIKFISVRLGHRSWSVTQDVYGHLVPEDQDVLVETWSRIVEEPSLAEVGQPDRTALESSLPAGIS